ncbi:MAG: hypothetical protein IJ207_11855 [Treponema sp.]|uniref:hypothetical protein n=1 Tax=Treponema sp. TaxID=166 RepID=UPI0025D1D345|nr:hypothetical protein [Treponema sp.]MBQ9282866.1 hypothetical protein [Treponema sp.]
MKNYDDIINTRWPPEKPDLNHPRMPLYQRAKIFLPFSALTGYEKALEKTLEEEIKSMEEKRGNFFYDAPEGKLDSQYSF